jgi:hypothetical protein
VTVSDRLTEAAERQLGLRLLPALLSLVAGAACQQPTPDGLHIEANRTTPDGVEVEVAFTHAGSTIDPRAASGDQLHVVVTDTDWGPAVKKVTGDEKQACESTVLVSSGVVDAKKKTATFHLTMPCPHAGGTVSRTIDVTLVPASGAVAGAPTTAHGYLQSYDANTGKIIFSK